MANAITFYIAVDADGDIGFHTDGADEAYENLTDNYTPVAPIQTFKIVLDMQLPITRELRLGVASAPESQMGGAAIRIETPK